MRYGFQHTRKPTIHFIGASKNILPFLSVCNSVMAGWLQILFVLNTAAFRLTTIEEMGGCVMLSRLPRAIDTMNEIT